MQKTKVMRLVTWCSSSSFFWYWWCRKTPGVSYRMLVIDLGTEAVERLALALERVDDVEGRHRLAASVLAVRDGVADDAAKEGAQDGAGLLVHQPGDALHATSARQTADCRLGDALDVIAHRLAMALRAALATLAAPRHD